VSAGYEPGWQLALQLAIAMLMHAGALCFLLWAIGFNWKASGRNNRRPTLRGRAHRS
jgi:hypothetical protein